MIDGEFLEYRRRLVTAFRAGRSSGLEAALTLFGELLAEFPGERFEILQIESTIRESSGDVIGALARLHEALACAPDADGEVGTRYALAGILQRAGRLAEATAEIESALPISPDGTWDFYLLSSLTELARLTKTTAAIDRWSALIARIETTYGWSDLPSFDSADARLEWLLAAGRSSSAAYNRFHQELVPALRSGDIARSRRLLDDYLATERSAWYRSCAEEAFSRGAPAGAVGQ